jgi:hypothetical protein
MTILLPPPEREFKIVELLMEVLTKAGNSPVGAILLHGQAPLIANAC